MSVGFKPVAVVGAGPAGFFTAEALLKNPGVRVDLFERLPAPYGLVRYGVAPDHQTIKKVEASFSRLLRDPRLRLFCNVEIGKHVSVETLQRYYWKTVFACGCASPRTLGVEGEHLAGVHHALHFVSWYNAHPDYVDVPVDLNGVREVVVIGAGDVALDVTRLLMSAARELQSTDMPDYAARQFENAAVERVRLLVRRGPAQAGFALKELRAIAERPQVRVRADQALLRGASTGELAAAQRAKLQYLLQACQSPKPEARFELRFEFLRSPHAFVAGADGRLCAVHVGTNALKVDAQGQQRAVDTGQRETLPAQLAITASGYRPSPIPGLPFDELRHVVPNRDGCVLGTPHPGSSYVVGWMRRGPTGVIGTNKSDARQVVNDLLQGEPPPAPLPGPEAIVDWLRQRGVHCYGATEWERIDALERALGAAAGRPRRKLYRVKEIVEALGCSSDEAALAPK